MTANQRITDIHCLKCGAPAAFDIVSQKYVCSYCGSSVGIQEAVQVKQVFRKIQRDKNRNTITEYSLFHAECTGSGADIVFEENEALADCPFCSRALVRKEYLNAENMPECIIPFAVTPEEAEQLLLDWCGNSRKPEARQLKNLSGRMTGIYLPYELIEGPVSLTAERMDGSREYRCEGYIREEFVNRSRQLDNILLDGMEPFDTSAMKEFDFAYAAGQRIKTADLPEDALEKRIREEVSLSYTPAVRKVLQTKAVQTDAFVSGVIRLPVLLPVYYIADGELMAAVNGQTGKVSVRALKKTKYYFLPWWLKAAGATMILSLLLFGALCLFGMNAQESMAVSGMTGFFFLIVTMCLYSDTQHNDFAVESGREIYTSGEKTFVRERGRLVLRDKILERKAGEPVFFETLDGKNVPVELRFATVPRILYMLLTAAAVIFLPVIIALFLNGFDFRRLTLGGSAVWFCITVPVVPIVFLKYGAAELYSNPWIYEIRDDGTRKRYRKKPDISFMKTILPDLLENLYTPPQCFGIWACIGVFCFMCWLTAFGF